MNAAVPAELPGLMQDFPLSLSHILRRMRSVRGRSEIVTLRNADGPVERITFAQAAVRIDCLAAGLRALGVGPGDRVGTFAWNTQEHFEAYFAVPCLGAVLHTANPRLSPPQIVYTINHAADRVLIVDSSLLGAIAEIASQLSSVEHFVVIGDGDISALPKAIRYEDLLAGHDPLPEWPEPDERAAAALCYTSGTTGNPKGVLYSHRSIAVHTLLMCAHDTYRLSARDRVLAVVPMFHAMGWNLPYVAGLLGADIVMPGAHLKPAQLVRLIEEERITSTSGVPTVWQDVLRYADEHASDLSSLEYVICGGARVPPILIRGFKQRHGVAVVQGWGMTEIFPGAAIGHEPRDAGTDDREKIEAMAGRVSPFYEIRIVSDDRTVQPSDGVSAGEIQVRGPAVASGYYNNPEADTEAFDRGWLRTGDIGTIDGSGWLRLTDRAKDVIKSGGEWISSIDLESALLEHPAVLEVAVVAAPDPRWTERPLACIVASEHVQPSELDGFLATRVATWWIPDNYAFVSQLPRTSVGKVNKKALREMHAAGELSMSRTPASDDGGRF
jgi:fatty-acyl-CoA synthase